MNVPPEGIGAFVDKVAHRDRVIIAPPFPYIKEVASRAVAAGQSCADQQSGAFTGEVSAGMLRDCGAAFVIIGHSERRRLYGETDELVARKLEKAIAAGLTPILCVGEDQMIRDYGGEVRFVSNQLRVAAAGLDQVKEIVVAYEPVWAIGTGRNATGNMIADMVHAIREALVQLWPQDVARTTPILYGGSVTPDNLDDVGQKGQVAGYLVGGASLDSAKFLPIAASLASLRPA